MRILIIYALSLPAYADKPVCFFDVQSIQYPKWNGDDSGVFRHPNAVLKNMLIQDVDTVLKLPPLPSPFLKVSVTQLMSKTNRELILSFDIMRVSDGLASAIVVQPVIAGKTFGVCDLVLDLRGYSKIPSKD